jgi:hypothetical protein
MTQNFPAFQFTSKRNNHVVVFNVREVVTTPDQWARRAKWVAAFAMVNNTHRVPVPAAYMAPAVVHAANF